MPKDHDISVSTSDLPGCGFLHRISDCGGAGTSDTYKLADFIQEYKIVPPYSEMKSAQDLAIGDILQIDGKPWEIAAIRQTHRHGRLANKVCFHVRARNLLGSSLLGTEYAFLDDNHEVNYFSATVDIRDYIAVHGPGFLPPN